MFRKSVDRVNKVKNCICFGEVNNEFSEKVVNISCVIKVVKGGCRFLFLVFVVVGDKKGKVGFGYGKVNEVFDVIKKVVKDVRNYFISVFI